MRHIVRQLLLCTVALAATGALPVSSAAAQTFTTLYGFAAHASGEYPAAGLTAISGSLYGVTTFGGDSNGGTVYRYLLSKPGRTTTLASLPVSANVTASLLSYKGLLYGISAYGGSGEFGQLFSINPATKVFTALHSFSGADGADATAPLIHVNGVLYGTTSKGGTGYGNIFSYNIATKTFASLHDFGNDAPYYPVNPTGGLVQIGRFLYGTTNVGGQYNNGTVFKIDIANNSLTVIYNFNATVGGCGLPRQGLTLVGKLLYGAASGTYNGDPYTPGAIFSINPLTGAETTLYSFTGGADGMSPLGQLVNVNGTLYGTTEFGGANGLGTVFTYNIAAKAQAVAYSFTGGTDGEYPADTLANVSGAVYGTTQEGGSGGGGTMFKLTVPGSN